MSTGSHVSRYRQGSARGSGVPGSRTVRLRTDGSPPILKRPDWAIELDHLAAVDAARQAARPKVPDRIICHGCGAVPRGANAKSFYHVSADGTAWECRRYPKCEV